MYQKYALTILFILCCVVPITVQAASLKHSFEEGGNGTVIGSSLVGLAFSIPNGEWYYGDTRVGGYDAPYPYGAFAVDGNGFAWTAQASGDARIAFTEGTATFFAADFSTRDSLVITGYNTKDQVIDSTSVRPNHNTGKLTHIRLEAPRNDGFAYVLIQGTQNRWIMDNLATDAPIPSNAKKAQAAFVTVAQHPSPNLSVAAGEIVEIDIVVTNRGRGYAKNARLTLPIDPSEVTVLDASFSRSTVWISQLLSNTVQLDTGRLASGGDVVTATLRLRVLEDATTGSSLAERISFRWSDEVRGGTGSSNLPMVRIDQANRADQTYRLAVENAQSQTELSISSSLFMPKEPVAIWYDTPEGKSIAVGVVIADDHGAIEADVPLNGLPSGAYLMVAFGQWSEITASELVAIQNE